VIALVDVSILVALFDPDHANHQVAHDWFEDQRAAGWATCPLTENGLIRVTASPSYFDPPHRPSDVIQQLRAFRHSPGHHFWPDALTMTDERVFAASIVRGPKQVTDIYLLGLATKMGGLFATLDTSIPLAAVTGATDANLLVISAAPEESSSGDS
jgi:toxin-antitoxin system PIN domain toxin